MHKRVRKKLPKTPFSKNEHSNSVKRLIYKEKAAIFQAAFCIGELDSHELAQNSVININFFLSHRSEVLAMKEQVQMIKGLLAA